MPLLSTSSPAPIISPSVLPDEPNPSTSASFPILTSNYSTDLIKSAKATHSTSVLDETILPQITNHRSTDEPDLDPFVTSAHNFTNLPNAIQSESWERKDIDESSHGSLSHPTEYRLIESNGQDNGLQLPRQVDWSKTELSEERQDTVTCPNPNPNREDQMESINPSLQYDSTEMVVLKPAEPYSIFQSSVSVSEFVLDTRDFETFHTSRNVVQNILQAALNSGDEFRKWKIMLSLCINLFKAVYNI